MAAGCQTNPAGSQSAQSQGASSQAGNPAAGSGEAGGTRDWSKVDSNRDGLIQPEEMESFLAQSKQSGSKR
jgi:hypothetical protein